MKDEEKKLWAQILSNRDEIEKRRVDDRSLFEEIRKTKDELNEINKILIGIVKDQGDNKTDDIKNFSELEAKIKESVSAEAKKKSSSNNKKWSAIFAGAFAIIKAVEVYWPKITTILDKLF